MWVTVGSTCWTAVVTVTEEQTSPFLWLLQVKSSTDDCLREGAGVTVIGRGERAVVAVWVVDTGGDAEGFTKG